MKSKINLLLITILSVSITQAQMPIQPVKTTIEEKTSKLSNFEYAKNRWITNLPPTDIPSNSYLARYFDKSDPYNIVKSEVVPKVSINYAWNKGPGFTIDSQSFGAHWVGELIVNKKQNYSLRISESHSDFRININGYEVLTNKSRNHNSLVIELDPGSYQVEVEFLNNWHTTGFAMRLAPETKIYSFQEAQKKITSFSEEYDTWYAGVYESGTDNHSINLDLTEKAAKPIVLLLDSYDNVDWIINNIANTKIAYIAYSSYKTGTSVTGDISPEQVIQLTRGTFPMEHSLEPDCYGPPDYDCESNNQLIKIDSAAINLTGQQIASFSGKYSTSGLDLPGRKMTADERDKILKSYEDTNKKIQNKKYRNEISNLFNDS